VGLHVLESRQEDKIAESSTPQRPSASSSWSLTTVSALAAVCWLLVLVGTAPAAVPVALARPLDRLPGQIGGWTKELAGLGTATAPVDWDKADSQILRHYRRTDGRPATLQIWYFETQRQDGELVNFRAAALHRDAVQRTIRHTSGTAFTANVTRSDGRIALFWYEIDGVPEAGQYAAKLKSLWTALTSRRSNAAAIMLSAPSTGESDDETVDSLQDLASQVHAALAQHWHPVLTARSTGMPGSPHDTH
jgi:EpsI family protein